MLRMRLIVAAALLSAGSAFAQVPNAQPPYNVDIGAVITTTIGVAATGTVNGANQNNIDHLGVVCTFAQTASSGAASTVFSIQAFDAATASWNTLLSSSAIAGPTSGVPFALAIRPGIAVSSLPTNYAAANLPLPRVWRPVIVVAGVNNSITAKVGCNTVK